MLNSGGQVPHRRYPGRRGNHCRTERHVPDRIQRSPESRGTVPGNLAGQLLVYPPARQSHPQRKQDRLPANLEIRVKIIETKDNGYIQEVSSTLALITYRVEAARVN